MLRTKTWNIFTLFQQPIKAADIEIRAEPYAIPEVCDVLFRASWRKELMRKQAELAALGKHTEIASYPERKPVANDAEPSYGEALYEDERPRMWPGGALLLKSVSMMSDVRATNTVQVLTRPALTITVSRVEYASINGLREKDIQECFARHNLALPRPPLAFCNLVLTSDNFFVFTHRGPHAHTYPNTLAACGGNPETVDTTVLAHQREELEEELLIRGDEWRPEDMEFGGFVEDLWQTPRKPDLMGWVRVKISREEMRRRLDARPENERPNDVAGVTFAAAGAVEIADFLLENKDKIVPVGIGGIFLYGVFHFGKAWADNTLKKLVERP